MTDLTDLLRRVQEASEIDEPLVHDLQTLFFDRSDYPTIAGLCLRLLDPIAAIGAALGLVERVLSGTYFSLENNGQPWECGLGDEKELWAAGNTAPLAILAALLRAVSPTKPTGNE